MTALIGWTSSLVLLLTIGNQVYRQWKSGPKEGVSRWLFVGQTVASTGFVAYSWLVKDWVFVVTNGLILLSAIIGALITWHQRRRQGVRQAGWVAALGAGCPCLSHRGRSRGLK